MTYKKKDIEKIADRVRKVYFSCMTSKQLDVADEFANRAMKILMKLMPLESLSYEKEFNRMRKYKSLLIRRRS